MSKSESEMRSQRQMATAAKVLDAILTSSGPVDLCRQIVHSQYVPEATRGCELFYLDSKSVLRSIASYGIGVGQTDGISAWDNSPMSEAIREKRLVTGAIVSNGTEVAVVALPFITNGVPVGLVAIVVEDKGYKVQITDEMSELFFKLGAFYLESLDFGNVINGTGSMAISPEDLTSRQLNILSHIENGLVNLEIAKILMLSESTIRQETVRIYRALGVGNRQEAVKKAKALGLLTRKNAHQPAGN
jgi:DNA-binding CsgD family transcriptional regulator